MLLFVSNTRHFPNILPNLRQHPLLHTPPPPPPIQIFDNMLYYITPLHPHTTHPTIKSPTSDSHLLPSTPQSFPPPLASADPNIGKTTSSDIAISPLPPSFSTSATVTGNSSLLPLSPLTTHPTIKSPTFDSRLLPYTSLSSPLPGVNTGPSMAQVTSSDDFSLPSLPQQHYLLCQPTSPRT